MKLLRRILIGIGLVLVALIVLLFGSIIVDSLLGGGRLAAVTNTRIPAGNGVEIAAYIARPSTPGPHPAVIMVHEFWGLNSSITKKADLLAQEGYVVIAPSMFRENTTDLLPRAIYQVVSTPTEQINADAEAVFQWLATQPDVRADRIAIMGFCFGGRTSLQYSFQQPQLAATVIFYGSVEAAPEKLTSLSGPVLGIFGEADSSIPLEEVRAFESGLQATGVPHQISIYPGQPHAFVQSVEGIQAGGAQGQAWAELTAFLKENLQGENSSRRPTTPVAANEPLSLDYLLALAWLHAGHSH